MDSASFQAAAAAVRGDQNRRDFVYPLYHMLSWKRGLYEKGAFRIFLYGGLAAAGVFVLTENLSTAVIVFGIAAVIFFVTYPRTKKIAIAFFVIVIGGLIAGQILGRLLESSGNFRLQRILSWVDPEKYAQSGAFQTMQGLLAIGSGGFLEKVLETAPRKWSFRSRRMI